MENDNCFLQVLLSHHKENNWKNILKLNENSNDKKAFKILWVWPNENNLIFLKNVFCDYNIQGVTSVGCGCGLLEWIIQQYTGLPVIGIEINKSWWQSKYSVPSFIPLQYVEDQVKVECNPHFALMFCYFNDGKAFREYVDTFRGTMIIIIGPQEGVARHTDPRPFCVDFGATKWRLVHQQEVKSTQDFIAIYLKNDVSINFLSNVF